jgi:Leucine-rich repeat (LRR) protein
VDKKADPNGPDYATLAAACAKFPEAQTVQIDECPGITSIAPLALMVNATRIKVSNFKNLDISPLSGLVKLELLEFMYSEIADLTPIGALPKLKKVDFYGAVLNDFSPLAGCPSLDEVYFYAAKLPPENYATLGNLKQVKKFHGGLTKMTSIAWLAQVPQAEELVIFAEKIADLSPLAGATNLKYLRVWSFDGGSMAPVLGDLSLLANLKNLETLELPSSSYSNLAALGGLTKLKKIDLSGAKAPLDLAFARSLPALEELDVSSPAGAVANFEALFGHPALKDVNLKKAGSVKSIAGLAQCPALKSVTVSKGVFPAEEVAALNAALQTRGKYNKVREY